MGIDSPAGLEDITTMKTVFTNTFLPFTVHFTHEISETEFCHQNNILKANVS